MNRKRDRNVLSSVAAIIPAGGAGSISNGKPKVLEEISDGRSIIGQVLSSLLPLGLGQIVVVVNNFLFREKIQEHLRREGLNNHVTWALQHWRLGAAEAVAVGLEKLTEDIRTVLVTYGDMPLWRTETFLELISGTLFLSYDIGMVYVPLTEKTPEMVRNYGRVLRNKKGNIMQIVEPSDEISEDLSEVDSVNPSLYVFNRGWLTRNLSRIEPKGKGDGFPSEFHMPQLIKIARDPAVGVLELELADQNEALGINTLDDLLRAQHALRDRTAVQV